MWVSLQTEPIRTQALLDAVEADSAGAVALFLGNVRDHNLGRKVLYLEYGAYEEMALRQMQAIAKEATERFPVTHLALAHRTGRLEIGESSVGVAVSSSHRKDAFEACRYVIDTLKQKVPIWKKEFFEGGEHWVEGEAPTS